MATKLAKKNHVVTKVRKKTKVVPVKKIPVVKKSFTYTETINYLVKEIGLPKKQVVALLEKLVDLISGHLKKGQPFSLLRIMKLMSVKKPATKSREGVNPFTGEKIIIKAKPARKIIKIKPLKKLKTAV